MACQAAHRGTCGTPARSLLSRRSSKRPQLRLRTGLPGIAVVAVVVVFTSRAWVTPPDAPANLAAARLVRACGGSQGAANASSFEVVPRRAAMASAVATLGAALGLPGFGRAFENALPEIAQYPRRTPGRQPDELGLKVRKLNRFDESLGPVLKGCGYGPNCFSTTGDPDDPQITTLLTPWRAPAGVPPAEAFKQLEEVLRAYPPGQQNVDGGGFRILTAADGYIYAQFESLKKGRLDDVEFAVNKDGSVQVRSAGRTGLKADYGSNARRLNYLSAQLRAKGWAAPEITKDTYPYYFSMNAGKTKVQCVGIDCPVNYELIAEEPGPDADSDA